MKTFEEFKASREKVDPSTRKMTEHQWGQAYEAYRKSRERSRSSSSSSSSSGKSRRRSSSSSSASGMHTPSTVSASGLLKAQVRAESAYTDLRLMVNLLSWVILAGIVIIAVLQGMALATPASTGVALLSCGIQALVVILLRMIIHAIIDIPDVALYRASHTQQADSKSAPE